MTTIPTPPVITAPPVTPTPQALRPRSRFRWLKRALLVCLVLLVSLALGVASYFQLGSETAALRDGLKKASGLEWKQIITLNIGSLTCGLARAGLSFAPLEDEARAAVQSIRGCEVGVYEASGDAQSADRAAMLAAADKAMLGRGWDRVVGVIDGKDLVAVYMPARIVSAKRMKCCVMVFDGKHMVVVAARANLDPLLQMALAKADLRNRVRQFAKR